MERYGPGHRERLRKRAQQGVDALRPHEIVELVLFFAVPRADVSDVARAMVAALGSPYEVFHAGPDRLMQIPGVTKGMAEWCAMTGELMDAYSDIRRSDLPRLWRCRDVIGYLSGRWRSVPAPQCRVLYLDYDARIMMHDAVCVSLYWWDGRCVRRIVEQALLLQAQRAILVQFVGTGPVTPEAEDREHLVSLARTLRAVEVELMDCLLVGEQGFYSMSVDDGMERARMDSELPWLHECYRGAEPAHEDIEGAWMDEQDRSVHEGEP